MYRVKKDILSLKKGQEIEKIKGNHYPAEYFEEIDKDLEYLAGELFIVKKGGGYNFHDIRIDTKKEYIRLAEYIRDNYIPKPKINKGYLFQ